MRFVRFLLPVCLLCITLMGCDPGETKPAGPRYTGTPPAGALPVYRLAIHPLHNPKKLAEAYQSLVDHLNRHMPGMRVELEASRDYQSYEEKIRARAPHFLLPNPWQTLEAMKLGYRVVAMAGDAADFRGIFIVRRDSPLMAPLELKGKVVSYPSQTALAACIMPQYFLHQQGIDVNKDLDNRYVGSQESSIMHAFLGQSAAAATWPPPWRLFQKDHPEEAAQLKVIWETPSLLNNSLMVRDDVPSERVGQLRELLLGLDQTPAGRAILAGMETARFHPADDATYAVVADYIVAFEKNVRPVEASGR